MQDLTKLSNERLFNEIISATAQRNWAIGRLPVTMEGEQNRLNKCREEFLRRLAYYDQAQENNPDIDSSKFCGGV